MDIFLATDRRLVFSQFYTFLALQNRRFYILLIHLLLSEKGMNYSLAVKCCLLNNHEVPQ